MLQMHQILKIANFEDKTLKNSVFFIYLMLQKFKALLFERFKYIQIRGIQDLKKES